MLSICFLQFAGFGGGIFESMPRTFNRQYRCYSVMLCPGNEREDVEKGGKSEYFIFYLGNKMARL